VLPLALQSFQENHPKTVVEIDTATYASALIALEEDRVDLAVTFNIPGMDGITIEWLAEADYVFAARQDHPLMKKPRVHADDLESEDLIGAMADRVQDIQETDDLRKSLEAPVERRIWCHTSSTRYALIAQGLASSLAEPFAAPLWKYAGVDVRPFEPRLGIEYCFAVPSAEQNSEVSLAFRAHFRKAMQGFAERHGLPIRA
jgi:DNA-binding transcriptional LysR family regulator